MAIQWESQDKFPEIFFEKQGQCTNIDCSIALRRAPGAGRRVLAARFQLHAEGERCWVANAGRAAPGSQAAMN